MGSTNGEVGDLPHPAELLVSFPVEDSKKC